MQTDSRRKILIEAMTELEAQGVSCMGCSGTCCTYEANSMMVSPLEAVELQIYLKAHALFNDELKEKLFQTTKQYRLDHFSGNGKRSFVRKTYTCPFFNHTELGCPLPREIKPYGCLAFNAHKKENKASPESCFSNELLQEKRAKEYDWEEKKNEELKAEYKIYWDKSPLPTALLDIWDRQFNDADLLPS